MAEGLEFDLKQMVLFNGTFGPREIEQLIEAIGNDFSHYRDLRDAVGELEAKEDHTPASNVRLGVCLYLLGRNKRSLDVLRQGDGGALANFYLGKTLFALQQYSEAEEAFAAAEKAGYPPDPCSLARCEALRYSNKSHEALAMLDDLSGAVEQTGEYLYQRGATVAKLGGNPSEVIALYERAVSVNNNHTGALFGLALENDRYGNDNNALELYKQAAAQFPAHVGSLLNIGLMYEDREDFEHAAQCYQRIIDVHPDHPRARLYLRDAQASGNMYYDEDAQKKRDRMTQMLSIPVTDFELSVRSRNCLRKMGIMTLGDLCRCTEQELLASKNFGETSLIEIKEMMASKGLRLGQLAAEKHSVDSFEPESLSADEQALLARPIADLGLSVRARKCMIRLGISMITELVRRTGDDLLECKNFGVTSLNEVREKLTNMGLQLRGD